MKVTTELFLEYLNFYKNRNKSDRTISILKQNFSKFIKYTHYYHWELEVKDITQKLIEEYRTELAETLAPKQSIYYWKNRFLSPKTVQMRIQAVKNFLHFTNYIYNEWLDYRTIDIPKIKNFHINFLEEDEIQKLLEIINQIEVSLIGRARSKLLVVLWYTTGLRLSELLNLQVSDVLWGKKIIKGKWGKERLIFFTPKTQTILKEYLHALQEPSPQTWRVIERKVVEEWVFISHNAYNFWGQLSKESVCGLFKKYNEKLNLPWKRITCHSLRHSFATRLLDKNINLREIQELMGHEDLKTTERYTHIRSNQLESAHNQAFWDF